jgi:predicted AAA+ superfamily ATPase
MTNQNSNLLTKTSDMNGNSSWSFPAELADLFNLVYDDDDEDNNILPPGDKNHVYYSENLVFNYPEKYSLWQLISLFEEMSAWNDKDIELRQKAYEDERLAAFNKIVAEVPQIKAYLNLCLLQWQNSLKASDVCADWLYSYLKSLADIELLSEQSSQKFVFLKSDMFGQTGSTMPSQVLRVMVTNGDLISGPEIVVRTRTYSVFTQEKVFVSSSSFRLPLMPVYAFGKMKTEDGIEIFEREPNMEKLEELGSHYLSLLNQAIEFPEYFEGTNIRTKYAEIGFKGLCFFPTKGRFVLSPELVEEHYETLEILLGGRVTDLSSIAGFQNWWLNRFGAAFNLQDQKGCLVPLDAAQPVNYRTELIENLFVDSDTKLELMALLNDAVNNKLYVDPVHQKASCLVLLNGLPGTGKTSVITALSEYFKRPLIHLSLGSIYLSELSSHLSLIFELAKAFNAFVLIDEADALIYQRQIDQMERSTLVAKALAALENFNGVVFLTSNVVNSEIDTAVKSRFTAHINFEAPDKKSHFFVWKKNLLNAGLFNDVTESQLDELAGLSHANQIDLRSIVGMVRKMSALHNFAVSRKESVPSIDKLFSITKAAKK